MKCRVDGCNRLAFDHELGVCTIHAGMSQDKDSSVRASELRRNLGDKRRKEAMMARLVFKPAPPPVRGVRYGLSQAQHDFQLVLKEHPGQWAKMPPELIGPGFMDLGMDARLLMAKNLVTRIRKSRMWRSKHGRFHPARRGEDVWVSWEPWEVTASDYTKGYA